MTTPEPQAPAEASETPVDAPAPDPDTDTGELPEGIEQAKKLRQENQSLRARAKAAEEAYEGELAKRANLEQGLVREFAAEVLHDPADLLAAHPDASAFWDDEFGGITRDRVVEQAKALAADKPWLLKPEPVAPPPSNRPIEGLRPGARAEEPTSTPTWADALRG